MKKLLTICLMLLGAVAQAQNFAITATTEAAIRKNIVKGNAANYGFGMINDTLKLVGLTTRNVIFTGLTGLNNYLPIANPTATGTLTAPTIANSLGANFATTSGNVGIGKNAPEYKLDVNGTFKTTSTTDLLVQGGNASLGASAGTNTVALEIATNRTGTGISYIDLGGESTNLDYGIRIMRNGLTSSIYHTGVGNMEINSLNTANILFATQNTERMRIFANGNVAIGKITDSGINLDVVGNIRATTGYLLDGATDKTISIQTALSNRAFFGGWQNGAYITSNRNPADGVFTDVTKAAAVIAVTGAANDSNIEFRTTATNNTLPGVRMYINKDGNVGIGTISPNASSILDITSTTQGVLFPRLTTTQISAIASPADGLTVYNTTLKAICFYDAGAAVWKKVSHSNM